MQQKIIYSKTISVFGDGFYDSNSNSIPTKKGKRKLSSKMKAIFQSMQDIAVPSFTEEVFTDFYSDGFLRADMRYMYDVANPDKVIGFLFTSFHERKVKGSKEKIYVGTAFPAIQKKYREDKSYEYNRLKMYIKFIWYYLKYLVEAEGKVSDSELKSLERLIKGEVRPLVELLQIVSDTFNKIETKRKMEIHINVENPSTYYDICRFNLSSNIPMPSKKELNRLLNMSKEELIKESQSKQNIYKTVNRRPDHVVEAAFAVNIHDQKANYLNSKNPYKKYFIINNPDYPDYAFKFIIPVDKSNIINMLVKAWEMERKQEIIQFIDNYCSLSFIQETIPSQKIKDLITISTSLKTNEYHLLTDDQMKLLLDVLGYKLA